MGNDFGDFGVVLKESDPFFREGRRRGRMRTSERLVHFEAMKSIMGSLMEMMKRRAWTQ